MNNKNTKENMRYVMAIIIDIFGNLMTGILFSILYTASWWYVPEEIQSLSDIWNRYCSYINYRIGLSDSNINNLIGYYACWIIYAFIRPTYYKAMGAYK